jgi:hypothetical protein
MLYFSTQIGLPEREAESVCAQTAVEPAVCISGQKCTSVFHPEDGGSVLV